MNKSAHIVMILLFSLTVKLLALEGNINHVNIDSIYFETISAKENLPNSIIYNIEQDSLGFLWLSSDDGLFRYDGKNFRIFRNTPRNPNSLVYNSFNDMHLDHFGNPWILYSSGLDKLDSKTGLLKHFQQEPTSNENLFMYNTYKFTITPENNIFISSRNNGLFYLNHNDSVIKNLHQEKQKFPAINDGLEAIAYKNNCLFVGKQQDGIFQISLTEDNSKILNVTKIADTKHTLIYTIFPDNNNNIWVGTKQGIIYINLSTGETVHFESQLRNNQFLPRSEVLSLLVDDNNNLWIGTREEGLSIVSIADIESNADQAKSIRYTPNNQNGSLSNRCINKIFKDSDGNIWLGTFSGGVQLVSNYNKKIHSLAYNPGHPESISHPKVWGITEDYNGNIWIGTDGGGIDIWNPRKGIFKRLSKKNGLSDNAILCALTDAKGELWFGTYRGGINRINPDNGRIKIYQNIPTPYPGSYTADIRILYQSPSGKIWAGTNLNGLSYYDSKTDSFINIPELDYIDVRAILEPTKGDLWVGTHANGLIYYNLNTKTKKYFTVNTSLNNSIPSNNINFLAKGDSAKIWIGTEYGGLSCLNTQNGNFENFDSRDGLANNTVLSILKDPKGYLWLSTNVGISRFDPSNHSFINYNKENGVLPGEFLNSSCINSKVGIFYFGSSSGLNFLNPQHIQPSENKPKVVFTNLKIFNEHVLPGNGIIDKNIEFNPIIHLNHKQSVFTIEFQAIQYPFANKCKYSFKLEGYDQEWNMAGINNSATYRQLPAGTYFLKVKASNTDGIWSDDIASIQIEVIPPFWLTIWAYILYAFTLLVITLLVSRFRTNQVKTVNQLHYEQKIRQEEQRIHQERLVFFTNISHELRTPLTMVECAVEDLKTALKNTRNKKVSELIKTASFHSTRLLELVNQLLEFRRVETGTPQISVEYLNINEWLSTYISNFKEMAKSKSIDLKLSMSVNSTMLYVDPDKLSMIMNNLISNAFKYTPKHGIIKVNTEDRNDVINIEVINSGAGISRKALPNIFDRYFKTENNSTSTGIGLSLTKSLVELHRGKISVSTIAGEESKFTLTFLKGNNHFEPGQLKPIESSEEIESDILIDEREITPIRNEDNQVMLIIEDNHDISSLLASKFSSKFEVKIAENGEKGIEIAQEVIPDIIISDIMMPGIQGTEVCTTLKTSPTTSHVPIILLTAKGTVEDELIGLTTGADDYISKPFNFRILEARVIALLKNRISLLNYFNENKTENVEIEINEAQQLEHEFLQEIEQLILKKYLNSDSSVFELAEDLNFSRSSLYRKIKMLTGKSINEFIRSVKIKEAANLLANKNITVSEVAYQVGFNDLRHFRENFVKQVGETPSAFKKKTRSS
ncbi:hybrid sensor histidine kinase/response regulator transcription factor [Saccharicrinis sp. GN24d3]|uniref:hybrid sensor histidine kinase/response regulator transcription factor n=1 Tax=Saccharicrinis sp. GN24d3 TaxID=3458416 RepID=UPI004035D762